MDRHLQLGEPSSFPFPSLPNDIHQVQDVPCTELSQTVNYSEFTSLDNDVNFGQPSLAASHSGPSEHSTFNVVANLSNDSIACAEAMVLGQELDAAPFLHMNNGELLMQDILSDFNDGNAQEALSSPEAEPSDTSREFQLPLARATVTASQFELNGNVVSSVFPVPQTQASHSFALDWTVADPADEHYSNAASSRKRPRTQELQHVSRLFLPIHLCH